MTIVHDTVRRRRDAGQARPAREPRPKTITVNGVTIPRAEIARETQHHPAAKPIDAWMAAAQALVVRQLLLQEAHRLGIEAQPQSDGEGRRETDEEAMIRQLVEREVVTPVADESACRRIYEQRSAQFRSPDLFAVRHILVAAAPGDADARSKPREAAQAIIDALRASPAEFASLAAAHSACPSRTNGGALGQISPGQTVPEFEAALAAAPVGEVCADPVESRYGFHVVVVDQRIDGERLPFEVVRDGIGEWLAARSRRVATRQYIAVLAGRAEISGIDLGVGSSPLVQ